MARQNWWTAEEDAILLAHYADGSDVVAAKTGRSVVAVGARAQHLGATRPISWSEREDDIIASRWGYEQAPEIAKLLGARSARSVYQRALKLGLNKRRPVGFLPMTAAAQRMGVHDSLMRKIVANEGVPTYGPSLPTRNDGRIRYVELFAVEKAFRRWLKRQAELESVGCAARRIGVTAQTMRLWLLGARKAGINVPKKPREFSVPWLVPSDVVDRVAAERLARYGCRAPVAKVRRVA